MAGLIVLYVILFVTITLFVNPDVTEETLLIRATATLAFLLLHIILVIGPLARLNPVFLPLLYNRRHLGVTFFVVCAVHGIFSMVQFHALGNINPILSIFLSNEHYNSYSKFPFQVFGFFALIIFFLMAITSHDFWLHNLGARFWKTLHMMVYVAYTLIILHVALGILQYETSLVFVVLVGLGMGTVITLHVIAGRREVKVDRSLSLDANHRLMKVCAINDIPENKAKVVTVGGERVAVFRYDNKIAAISNVCKHQNGPLGEGRIIDGCVTCPWHGYQYLPHNGCSPPPFTEKVPTYDVSIVGSDVWINPVPYPAGTERKPALVNDNS
jgi:nitrite reductase/ring-hydroxylating ferredoxin subunit/DMSO/TMAO reductase YedYZ heme-binding membrane subunit